MAYKELSDEYEAEVRKKDEAIAALKQKRMQLEDDLSAKNREVAKLQNDLEHQETKLKLLHNEVGKRKEPKKGSRAKSNTDMPSTNEATSHDNPGSHGSVYTTQSTSQTQ